LLLIMIPNLAAQRKNADTRSEEAFRTTIKTQKELYEDNHDGKIAKLDDLKNDHYITDKQYKKVEADSKFKEEIESPAKIEASTPDAKS